MITYKINEIYKYETVPIFISIKICAENLFIQPQKTKDRITLVQYRITTNAEIQP